MPFLATWDSVAALPSEAWFLYPNRSMLSQATWRLGLSSEARPGLDVQCESTKDQRCQRCTR